MYNILHRLSKRVLVLISVVCILFVGTSCGFDFSQEYQEDPMYALEILDTSGVNNQGVLTVTGEIKNVSDRNITKVIVSVTFYNSSNEEIATQNDIYENLLLPDETYKFKVNCLKKDATSYQVNVNGEF